MIVLRLGIDMKYTYKVEIEILAEDGADAESQYWEIKQSVLHNEGVNVIEFCCTEARDEDGVHV